MNLHCLGFICKMMSQLFNEELSRGRRDAGTLRYSGMAASLVSSCPGERERDIVRGITVSSFLETSTLSPLKSPALCARQDFFS